MFRSQQKLHQIRSTWIYSFFCCCWWWTSTVMLKYGTSPSWLYSTFTRVSQEDPWKAWHRRPIPKKKKLLKPLPQVSRAILPCLFFYLLWFVSLFKIKAFLKKQPYRVSPPHNKTRFLHLNDCYKPIAVTNAVSLSSGLCFKPVRKTQEERWKKTLKEIVVLFKVTFCIWNQSVLWLWHSSPKSIWFPQLQLVKIVLIIYSFNM